MYFINRKKMHAFIHLCLEKQLAHLDGRPKTTTKKTERESAQRKLWRWMETKEDNQLFVAENLKNPLRQVQSTAQPAHEKK